MIVLINMNTLLCDECLFNKYDRLWVSLKFEI